MIDFFADNPYGKEINGLRYAFTEAETWDEECARVAEHVARAERDYARWAQEFHFELVEGHFMPGGRIMYGCGRNKSQLINCFVTPAEDSREGWGKLTHDNIVIAGTGGGNGTNYSDIRPRGFPIAGTGGYATGPVSLMRVIDATAQQVKGGGGRRAALMMCLNHDHPDILEFLNAKLESKQLPEHLYEALIEAGYSDADIPQHLLRGDLSNANISVVFMNESPEDFFEKVRDDADHELKWQGKVVKTIKARQLWDLVVKNALKNGEPGVLNGYLANKMNNISYCRQLVSTNPCGEIWMQPYSVCCLGAVVLPRFVDFEVLLKHPEWPLERRIREGIRWDMLHTTVSRGVRFLDDVLDVTYYPLPEVEAESKATRRIGLGVMGLHDMLLLLGVKYSSEEALTVVDKVMAFIKHCAYDTSTYLAVEKGCFTEFDAEAILRSGFIKTLKPSVRNKIADYGLRNCALLTIAPTGTTSIVQGVTGGIEPMFAPAYLRRHKDQFDTIHGQVVVHPLFEKFVRAGYDVSHFEGASDISPEAHLRLQTVCQRHVDNSISKTVNIPKNKYTPEMLSGLYEKYLPDLKGITIYPEGSRNFTPLERISNEEGIDYIHKNVSVVTMVEEDCPSGVCEVPQAA